MGSGAAKSQKFPNAKQAQHQKTPQFVFRLFPDSILVQPLGTFGSIAFRARIDFPPVPGQALCTSLGKIYFSGGENESTEFGEIVLGISAGRARIGFLRCMSHGRGFHCSVALEGCVFAICGRDKSQQPIRSCEVYRHAEDRWKEIADMPTAKFGMAVAACCESATIYTFCGYLSATEESTTVECYDVKSDKWQSLVVQGDGVQKGEGRLAAQVSRTEILLFGGAKGAPTYIFDVEKRTTNRVKIEEAENTSMLMLLDSGLPSAFCKGRVYAMGAERESDCFVYSVKKQCWNALQVHAK